MIHEGSEVRLTCEFRDPFGGYALVDPENVFVAWLDPSDNYTEKTYGTDPEVIKDATGIYHIDIAADEGGEWKYRWWSTGTIATASEASFLVAGRAVQV